MASAQRTNRTLHENQVTLYIATHNKTGLKYFGKTIRFFNEEDLQQFYHGSGTYWNNHLNKHGDDVTMSIYGIYNLSDVEKEALKFSEENNIVESNEWANLITEDGLNTPGGTKGFLAVRDLRDGETKHVTIEDFNNFEYYVSPTKGIVTVFDTVANKNTQIAQDEYNSQFKQNKRYKLHSEGCVNCVDIRTGETKKVTKEEFDNNDNLQNPMKGMLPCIDTRTNKKVNVSQIDYKNYDYYVSTTSAAPVAVRDLITNETSLTTKEEYMSNPNLISACAKFKIIIFDNHDNQVGFYIGTKLFNQTQDISKLKQYSIKKSIIEKTKIFSKQPKNPFHNWYAIREEI